MTKTSLLLIPVIALAGALALPASRPANAQAAAPDGATLFRMRCASCHAVAAGQRSVLAPNLNKIVGRKAGAAAFNYSAALKASNLTWTRANLDGYLAAPLRKVPGTRMVMALPDAAQRSAVLNYLATLK